MNERKLVPEELVQRRARGNDFPFPRTPEEIYSALQLAKDVVGTPNDTITPKVIAADLKHNLASDARDLRDGFKNLQEVAELIPTIKGFPGQEEK